MNLVMPGLNGCAGRKRSIADFGRLRPGRSGKRPSAPEAGEVW